MNHPSEVSGRYQTLRARARWLLVAFLLALPWIKVGGEQALQIDLARREFTLLGAAFHAHDAPMIVLVALSWFFLVMAVTVIWGRIWCGWACPQTVFVESLFRPIERWIEGDAVARRRLDAAPMSVTKSFRRALKWACFLALALLISHSLLAVFVGGERLLAMLRGSPRENWAAFVGVSILTLITLIDFGVLRERFCTYFCPYGKLQSVLMDRKTWTIAYDLSRTQDCVDCRKCVQVCPTGIDIREGSQLECIGCAACIDACDLVMKRLSRPQRLIRYATELGARPSTNVRGIVYGALSLGCVVGLAVLVANRSDLSLQIIKASHLPFSETTVETAEGPKPLLINLFHSELTNNTDRVLDVQFGIDGSAQLHMPSNPFSLKPGELARGPFTVWFDPNELTGGSHRATLRASWRGPAGELREVTQEVKLVGPTR